MSAARFALIPAAYVYLRRGDEILLQRRQNTGYMDGHWSAGAAGHIERGETAAATAAREVAEELGITIAQDDLAALTVLQRTDGTAAPIEQRVEWFFSASRWTGTPQIMEAHKCAELAWFSLHELPERVPPHERVVLEGLAAGHLDPFTSVGY